MRTNEGSNVARVCVPVCVRRARELRGAAARAAALADVVELRLDCLEPDELGDAFAEIDALLESAGRPLILTFRTAGQGGTRAFGSSERAAVRARVRELLERRRRAGLSAPTHFVDLEFDDELTAGVLEGMGDVSDVICSHHDFDDPPADLEELYARMSATGARVLKIAVMADDVTHCLAVFRLLERARRDGRETIALAMGEAGVMTRILGPSRGAFLTYGALDSEQRTAPGQVSAEDLRSLYRVASVDAETLITGLVGSPVSHSLSPHMHNAAFAATGLNAVYIPFEVGVVGDFMRRMVGPRSRELEWNLRGLSVTAPHKSAVIPHLDRVEEKASEIGAVNTVVAEGDELHGHNTDAEASLAALPGGVELRGARVAVLGAGGAARAVLWSLRERGAKATVFARRRERARDTARRFGAEAASLDGARFDGYEVVINATPLGARGPEEGATAATAEQLRGARLAYDLVYNPSSTRFIREAREAGCETVGGLPMLVAQAAAQFKLWTGHDAPRELMRAAAEKKMSADGR